jgi:hypothetical protein
MGGDAHEPAIQQQLNDIGIRVFRLGGNQWDRDGKTANAYITAIANIKAKNPNAIFIIQVPVRANDFGMTAADAANIVDSVRAVYPEIIYFSVGNEWDKYKTFANSSNHNTLSKMVPVFKAFVTAMKQVPIPAGYQPIKIVGPSPNSFSSDDILLETVGNPGGSNDLTREIPELPGKYYLDVISWNTYSPLGNNQDLNAANFYGRRDTVIKYPGESGSKFLPFRLQTLDGWITQANTAHNRTGNNALKFAVTEMNINYYNPKKPSPTFTSKDLYTNTVYSLGAASFINGQFRADFYANLLKHGKDNCLFMTPWSIMTSSNDRDTADFALFDDKFPNQRERSVYWHTQLMAQHFAGGTYYMTTKNAGDHNLKVITGTKGGKLVVMILNQNSSVHPYAPNTVTIHFGEGNPSGSAEYKFKTDANTGFNFQRTIDVKQESTLLLEYDSQGYLVTRCEYGINDAYLNNRPTCNYASTSVPNLDAIDLYIKDNDLDNGTGASSDPIYISPDVCIRISPNDNDMYDDYIDWSQSKDSVFVKVKIRNRGTAPSLGTEKLMVYWAKSGAGQDWPNPWQGLLVTGYTDLWWGKPLGEVSIPPINPGEDAPPINIPWYDIPDPARYRAANITEPQHFCLLARIVASNDPMQVPEQINQLPNNVRYNNNVAWKNIAIMGRAATNGGGEPIDPVDPIDPNPGISEDCDLMKTIGNAVSVANYTEISQSYNIVFSVPQDETGTLITEEGNVFISLNDRLYDKWVAGGKQGTGFNEILSPPMSDEGIENNQINTRAPIELNNRKMFELSGARTSFDNITLDPGETEIVSLMVTYPSDPVSSKSVFNYDIQQVNSTTSEMVGGVRYMMLKPVCGAFEAGADRTIERGSITTLDATPKLRCAKYWWINEGGGLISREPTINVKPNVTTTYKLRGMSIDGCYNEDKVTVYVQNKIIRHRDEIIKVSPNPARDRVLVEYKIEHPTQQAQLRLTKADGSVDRTYSLDLNTNQKELNISDLHTGSYTVILVSDGVIADVTLPKNRTV